MAQKFDALAARKELLQMKAQLQRMELGAEVDVLKQEFAWLGAFKQLGAFFANRNLSSLGPLSALGGQLVQDQLKKHPLLGFVASAALVRFRQPLIKATWRAGLGALVLAGAVMWFKGRGGASAP